MTDDEKPKKPKKPPLPRKPLRPRKFNEWIRSTPWGGLRYRDFDPDTPMDIPVGDRGDHPEERQRVFGKIAPLIMQFAEENIGREFLAEELFVFVMRNHIGFVAPESPGRIFRELRLRHWLDYLCTDRRNSLFKITAITANWRYSDAEDADKDDGEDPKKE